MSKTDPTRTATLRRRFMADVKRRMAELKRAVVSLVVEEDAFGLSDKRPSFSLIENRYQAETDQKKAQKFQEWLAQETKDLVDPDLDPDQWYLEYIDEAYRTGAGRAFDDTRKASKAAAQTQRGQQLYEGSRRQFLEQSFGQRVAQDKVEFLASRVFTDLKGITAEIEKQLTRALVDGISQGDSPRTVARNMLNSIDSITKQRALTIARTETVRAHAEGQLDALEKLGVIEI